ncbi:MAG: response regulator transcription factor [Phycisphaerales bacterium]|nr:response regulator transcription factor [Phycisphaerales bacterium]
MVVVPIRVLCVDDNEHVCDAMRVKLNRTTGFEWVGHLPDASTLLDEASRLDPDVVLLDLDMPGPAPLTVVHALRSKCPDVRVVILSGYLSRDLVEQAIEAGARGYVHKGEDVSEVLRVVRAVAAGSVGLSPDAEAALVRR